MRVVRAARLHLKEGASDKVYEVDLVENDAVAAPERFLVNIRYGRRGAVLREGSKTPQPIAADAAAKVFDSVVVAKINGGYRRSDQPVASSVTGASGAPAEGRDGILLARLASCRRGLWPEKDRERLLWRIGQLRIAQAEPDLVAMVQDVGPSGASYALVWALARAVGGKAAPILEAVAAETGSVVIRDLARFALVSPLMGAQRRRSGDEADLPEAVARPARAGDADGLVAAMTALARGKPLAVGPALVALGRCAQDDVALHAGLCAALPLLPARPPYLIGLRRLFKHAEMADDAGLFGATALRLETAKAMYKSGDPLVYSAELRRQFVVRDERGGPDARIGLSSATSLYLKRRIWRALRKRGEVGDPAFAEMAAGLLLTVRPEDLGPRTVSTLWRRQANGTWGREPRLRGPLATQWAASHLLFRHAPQARPRSGSATFFLDADIDLDSRDEAFPDLWSARPDLALRLATEGRIDPVAILGLRVLRADAAACAALDAAAIGRLLGPTLPPSPPSAWRSRGSVSPAAGPIPNSSPSSSRPGFQRRECSPCGGSRPRRICPGRTWRWPSRCSRVPRRRSRRRSSNSPASATFRPASPGLWPSGWWRGYGRCRRSSTRRRRHRSGPCAPACRCSGRTTTCRCPGRISPR